MNIKQVVDGVAVAEQISASDVDQLAAEGFRSIICNRPDGESADQPDYVDIKLAAGRNGMQIRGVPVVSGKIANADVAAFAQALQDLPGPVLAYCRSGTRSIQLWALASASQGVAAADIVNAARQAGYDLAEMRAYLQQMVDRALQKNKP